MTELRHLADRAPFLTSAGHFGRRLIDRGRHGVRVELETEDGRIVRYLHGCVRVHELPWLSGRCNPPTSRKRTYERGSAEVTYPVHAPVPQGRKTA